MKAIAALLVLFALQACVDSEQEPIELELSSKTDGTASAIASLEPGQKVGLIWRCDEWLDLNGCDITMILHADAVTRYAIGPGTRVGTFTHLDIATRAKTDHAVVIGKSEFVIEAPEVSSHSGTLENTSNTKLAVSIEALWH